jgi:hypothetical protein
MRVVGLRALTYGDGALDALEEGFNRADEGLGNRLGG